jgi:hypothetical protein
MKIFAPSIILVVAAVLVAAPGIEAQDRSVTWTRTTQIDVPGDLGTLLRAIPGGLNARQSEHGIHLSGRKVRQDDGSGSMIIDLDERRWTSLDHDARMFTAMSFDQSIEMARQMAAGMEGEMEEAQAEWRAALEESREEREAMMAEMREAMAEVGEELALDIDVRQTGETRSFDGFNATRRMVIATAGVAEGVEGVDEVGAGQLVFAVDLWQTADFPSADHVYEQWAMEMAQDPELRGFAEEMASAFLPDEAFGSEALAMWDPRMAAGLERVAERIAEFEGTPLRTVTTIAFVPAGVEMDVDALLAWEPASMGDRVRQAAAGQAREAARGALRNLSRGLLGGDRDAAEEETEPEMRPLLRMTTEIADIRDRGAPAADLFQVPAGYGERAIPMPGS